MKSKISIFALSFATVCMVSSCLGDSNEEYTYYDDAALTSFKLGTINCYRYAKATKDGRDSLYKAVVSGNSYAISIDQYAGTITNAPDSLPSDADLKHLLVSVSTAKNGYVRIKSTKSDSLFLFSSSDSLDFSQPRVIEVLSSSQKATRTYTVNIVAHKENPDSFKWNKMDADEDIKNYTRVKAGICNGNLAVLGQTSTGTELKTLVDGSWKTMKTFGADAVMANDDKNIYVTDEGIVYVSSDATNWQTIETDMKSVFGYCGSELFAMSKDNELMVSYDNGISWAVDEIDEEAQLLPASEYNFIATQTSTNSDVMRAFMIGNSTNSVKAAVWSKIIEKDASKDQTWIYQAFKANNYYYLPNMKNLSIAKYADGMIAAGDNFDKIYYSKDCGLTWKKDDRIAIPTGFSAENASMTTDAKGYIWIVCTGSGQVWRGRLNKVAWED